MRRSTLLALALTVPVAGGVLAAPQSKLIPARVKLAAATEGRPAAPAAKPMEVPPPDFPAMFRNAVERSLPPLQRSAAVFAANRTCISCHNQILTAATVNMARQYGYLVDEKQDAARKQELAGLVGHMHDLLQKAHDGDRAAEKQLDFLTVDPAISVGYFALGMKAQRIGGPDAALLASYLARKQAGDGRWPVIAARPPEECSEFTSTALAVRALRTLAPQDTSAETAARIDRARVWLLSNRGKTTEDVAFRLMGLAWSGASQEEIRKAVADVAALQQDDGGWAQILGRATDAYATGVSLAALREAGVPVTESLYLRGAIYLMLRQEADGPWKVETRSRAAQPYFDAGFPHGKSQFISAAGTAWATMALIPVAAQPTAITASR